jgi:hydrogenase expression/formation protein HypC
MSFFTMCLAIPAQVQEFLEDNLVVADFGRGVKREVSIALLGEELEKGDWILIHTGYAVSKMSPEEAQETLALWEELWRMEEEKNKTSSKP